MLGPVREIARTLLSFVLTRARLAGGAVLAAIRPRRAIGWIAKGWSLYRLYRNLLPVWQRFAMTTGAADRPRHPS